MPTQLRTLTMADGQMAASAGTILAGSSAPDGGGHVDFMCHNTGSSEETVILTFQRAGGTARRLARAVLQENEALLVTGIPLQPDDTLLGVTTTASVVDYLVVAGGGRGFYIDVLAADGVSKGVAVLRKLVLGMEVLADGTLADPGQ